MYIEKIDDENVRMSLNETITREQLYQIYELFELGHKDGQGNKITQDMATKMREYFHTYPKFTQRLEKS